MDGDIKHLLKRLVELDGSDLFLKVNLPAHGRIDGKVVPLGDKTLTKEDIKRMIEGITTPLQREILQDKMDVDFALYLDEIEQRFRVSIFYQLGFNSLVIRQIRKDIQKFQDLNLPSDVLTKLSLEKRGLILLTGAAGSGKSTTIASMIDCINENTNKHILTVEEPIEFTFKDKKSVINQRELGVDVFNYQEALRAFTLQSPDVIYIANIRDVETMSAALTA
ncbi:MAG: ATPase, T2SS/T4P/T4SS family, partial [Candidatus Omnitrophota bacterium]